MALAVHPAVTYCVVEHGDEKLIVAEPLLHKVFGDEPVRVTRTCVGSELAGVRYQPLYDYCTDEKDRYYVIPAEFVTTEDGTGIVHVAPAYGPDDLALGKAHKLPIYYSVDFTGHVVPEVTVGAGLFFKDADKPIMADLKRPRAHVPPGDLPPQLPVRLAHRRPVALLSPRRRGSSARRRASASSSPTTTRSTGIRRPSSTGALATGSRTTSTGRCRASVFGARRCRCGAMGPISSASARSPSCRERCGRDLAEFDLHRPAIDAVSFSHDGREYRRVPEVLDAWFDSGSMPYAQFHYPFENDAIFKESFPADFIAEAVDQTRGWFYSLHAIATLLFDGPAYKNVICLGHVVDSAGEKMSKSRGNVIDPYLIFDTLGADALRWYFFTGSPPGEAKRVSVELVEDGSHKLVNTLWNTAKFFTMYANADGVGMPPDVPLAQRTDLDRWLVASCEQLTADVTRLLERYDALGAGRAIERFVDDMSNWYVRLSRDRFWGGGKSADKDAAYRTLYESLTRVTLVLAPFTPFLAESLYQYLVKPVDPASKESVHLCTWPQANVSAIDEALLQAMGVAKQAVDLGRQARAGAKIKTRQPLAVAHVRARTSSDDAALARFRGLVLEELNVKDVAVVGLDAQFIEYALRPNLPRLGPRYGKQMQALRAALAAADARAVAAAVAAGTPFEVGVDGQTFKLEPDDVLVDSKSAHGFAFAEGDGMLVALDTRVTRELALEGLARETVRAVQDARKQAGLDISDRIHLRIDARGDMAEAMTKFRDYIMGETLATTLNGAAFDPSFTTESVDGMRIALSRAG